MKKSWKYISTAVILLAALVLSALPVSAYSLYPPIVMSVENCSSCITLRAKPDARSAEITKIPLGEDVTYLSAAPNGFYRVRYNGYTGYALSKYLGYSIFPSEEDTEEDFFNAETPRIVVDCKEYITLRDNDDGKGVDILKLPLGAVVDYIGSGRNGFCEVSFRGVQGYALEEYLQPYDGLMEQEVLFTMKVVKCKKSITLRNTPSTKGKEILQIPLGATVGYIDSSTNGFYKVSYKGYVGYALSMYLG